MPLEDNLHETYEELLLVGVNLSKNVSKVNNIESLIDISDDYSEWFLNIKEFLEKLPNLDIKIQSMFFQSDSVIENRMKGGVGVDFFSDKSQLILSDTKKEIENKMNYLRQIPTDSIPHIKILYFRKNTLNINGEIIIFKNTNNLPYALLKVLMSNKSKVRARDEILEEMGENDAIERITKNRVYNSARDLNEFIAQNSTIKDFVKFTTKETCINPKYL